MFFGKKKKEIDLPPMPELPDFSTLPELKPKEAAFEFPPVPTVVHATELPFVPENIPELGQSVELKSVSLLKEIEKHKELEVPELEERKEILVRKESFVSIDSYKEIIGNVNVIKSMLGGTADSISRVIDVKKIKDSEFEAWQRSLQSIGKGLMQIDKSLFEKVM